MSEPPEPPGTFPVCSSVGFFLPLTTFSSQLLCVCLNPQQKYSAHLRRTAAEARAGLASRLVTSRNVDSKFPFSRTDPVCVFMPSLCCECVRKTAKPLRDFTVNGSYCLFVPPACCSQTVQLHSGLPSRNKPLLAVTYISSYRTFLSIAAVCF